MKTVIQVEKTSLWRRQESTLYTNFKKAVIDSGLQYNTVKKFKMPFEYRNYYFQKVEVK